MRNSPSWVSRAGGWLLSLPRPRSPLLRRLSGSVTVLLRGWSNDWKGKIFHLVTLLPPAASRPGDFTRLEGKARPVDTVTPGPKRSREEGTFSFRQWPSRGAMVCDLCVPFLHASEPEPLPATFPLLAPSVSPHWLLLLPPRNPLNFSISCCQSFIHSYNLTTTMRIHY